MIEEGITYLLQHDPAIKALVSDRSFAVAAPKDTPRPYLTWQCVASSAEQDLSARGGTRQTRIQFDAYADFYLTAKRILDAIRLGLDRANDSKRLGRESVQCVLSGNILDLSEDPQSGQNKPIFHSLFDAEIFHTEEIGQVT